MLKQTSNLPQTILIISCSDLNKANASCNRLLALSRGLSEINCQVIWLLISPSPPADIVKEPKYEGIRFLPLLFHPKRTYAGKAMYHIKRAVSFILLPQRIKKIHRDHDIKACFTTGDSFIQLKIIQLALSSISVKIFHERTEYPFLNIPKLSIRRINILLYFRYFICNVDHLFMISTPLRELYEQYLDKRNIKIPVTILNMIVEPDRFEPNLVVEARADIDPNKFRNIVYIGTMYGSKDGIDILIKSFNMIKKDYPDLRLILIGDDSRKSKMKKVFDAFKSHDHQSQIVFTGKINREKVSEYLNQAYALVLARPNNIQAKYGFPTKLGEYLATGKPVIITRVGDIPLFLRDNYNAYLADPDDVFSFAEKMRDCLDNPNEAKLKGEKGKELTYTVFNYRSCGEIVKKFLRQ